MLLHPSCFQENTNLYNHLTPLTINGQVLQRESNYKYLGVTLSDDGSLSLHIYISNVCNKARKVLGLLYQDMNCDQVTLLHLYQMLVRPHDIAIVVAINSYLVFH